MPSVVKKLRNELCAFFEQITSIDSSDSLTLASQFASTLTGVNAQYLALKKIECCYFKQIQNVEFLWFQGSQTFTGCGDACAALTATLVPVPLLSGLPTIYFTYEKTVWIACNKMAKLVFAAVALPISTTVYQWYPIEGRVFSCLDVCNCRLEKTIKPHLLTTATMATAPHFYLQFNEAYLKPRCFDSHYVKGKKHCNC